MRPAPITPTVLPCAWKKAARQPRKRVSGAAVLPPAPALPAQSAAAHERPRLQQIADEQRGQPAFVQPTAHEAISLHHAPRRRKCQAGRQLCPTGMRDTVGGRASRASKEQQ